MSDWQRFRAAAMAEVSGPDIAMDVLRHEMAAVMNRKRLTGQDEGLSAFNTDQLIWMAAGLPDDAPQVPQFVSAIAISGLIEGRPRFYDEAKASGYATWGWAVAVDGFTGSCDDLLAAIDRLCLIRERSGAVCLALRTAPAAAGSALLAAFRKADTGMVYHRILDQALAGRAPDLPALAAGELAALASAPEVLFASDVDMRLATLVRASGRTDLDALLAPFGESADDLTRIAWARNYMDAGRPEDAARVVKDVRLLSPAWPEASIIAAAANLELGRFDRAAAIAPHIEDEPKRLMVQVRVAQASRDVAAEAEALARLHEIMPGDPDAALQLLGALHRLGQAEQARLLAAEMQERYLDRPEILAIARRFLVR
jgi:hypothetical protein